MDEVSVGVVEVLEDEPGLRMPHSLTYCNQFSCLFCELWFSTAGPMVCIPLMILAEFPE